jgi:uncharacterized protein with NRDE domain
VQAGGTSLTVSRSGFFAALTNQRQPEAGTGKRSRGEVVLETARAGVRGGVAAARAWLEASDPSAYNPYNLLFGDREQVWVAYGRQTLTLAPVPPGLHVLPNDVLDSAKFPKVRRILGRLQGVPATWEALRPALLAALADDGIPDDLPDEPDAPFPEDVRRALHAVWVRLPFYGTRSSSLVALRDDGEVHYAFIDGPPDGEAVDHSGLL